MNKENLKSVTQIKVRFNECDPLQIVWHGNYYKYLEDAREDFCNRNKLGYLDMKKKGIATPIVKSLCEYKSPLKYGDIFNVEASFIPTEAAKIIFNYTGFLDDKVVFTGETVQVFLDENEKMLLQYPSFFLDWKKKMGLL